jgi:hypothetical protein
MSITWPTNTVTVIDDIRGAIGRDIFLYRSVSGIPCPYSGDSLDPITNLSTNQFCPVCSGNYWLNTVSGITITAHVTWAGADQPIWVPGGRIVNGDCLVQIKYTVVNMDHVDNSEYFIVDSRKLIKKTAELRGVPNPNRILVALVEQER